MSIPVIPVNPEQRNDEHCRHKMELMMIKSEGSGNGIKVVFTNIETVCKKLNRPPLALIKFFNNELGTLAKYQSVDNKYLVMGSFPQDKIQEKVYDFIKRFVLCPKCKDPGTHFYQNVKKKKSKLLMMKCSSCGHEQNMDDNPNNSRVNRVIEEAIESGTAGDMLKVPQTTEGGAAAAAGAGAAATAATTAATATTTDAKPKATDDVSAAAEAHGEDKWIRPANAGETQNPIVELSRALQASSGEAAGVATAKAHQLKTVLNMEDDEVVRLCFQAAVASGAEDGKEGKPLEALQKRAAFLRNFVAVARSAGEMSKRLRFILELVRIFKPGKKDAPGASKADRVPIGIALFLDEGIVNFDDVQAWASQSLADEVKKEAKKGKATFYRDIAQHCAKLFDWMGIDLGEAPAAGGGAGGAAAAAATN